MGFAQPGPAVDEQGVVGIGRVCSHRQGCRVGKFVGGAHDKGGEGVFIIAALAALLQLFLGISGQHAGLGRLLFGGGVAEDFDVYTKA